MYINNIIIFSRLKEKYLYYINKVLITLLKLGITFFATKYYFGYPSIKLLGYYISRLDITILPEKIKTIIKKAFLTNLKLLEYSIGFFNYYRCFIERFISIIILLVKLKKIGFCKNLPAGKAYNKFILKIILDLNKGIDILTNIAYKELIIKIYYI